MGDGATWWEVQARMAEKTNPGRVLCCLLRTAAPCSFPASRAAHPTKAFSGQLCGAPRKPWSYALMSTRS